MKKGGRRVNESAAGNADKDHPSSVPNLDSNTIAKTSQTGSERQGKDGAKEEHPQEGRVFWTSSFNFLMSLIAFAMGLGMILSFIQQV